MSKQNGMYGYIAGICVAALLQPLENVKIALMFPPSHIKLTNNFISNFNKVFKYLSVEGGVKSFYKGLIPNVIKTGFSSAIFFSSLRFIQSLSNQDSFMRSFGASGVGRVMSAIASNPLQVVETRYELAGKDRWSGGLLDNLLKVYKHEGLSGYFKGCLASCYKEGFFAGLYYSLYLTGKSHGIPTIPSGIISGLIATTVTHPFQLIKSKLQLNLLINHQKSISLPIFTQIVQLSKNGEAFRGLTPRLIKKPLSNTIAFLIFEKMEQKNKLN